MTMHLCLRAFRLKTLLPCLVSQLAPLAEETSFPDCFKCVFAIKTRTTSLCIMCVLSTCSMVQSNLSYPDSCYPGTSLNQAADLPYFMLTLQKFWAIQWVWPIIAYVFILYSEIRTNLSYGHPLIPRRPDKRGLTVL